ncbi:MAG: hypothetical protein FWD61_14575 [Phycisphaerales bacterium]|nr:hypothetical protein [Phycisphaerales bacterium]
MRHTPSAVLAAMLILLATAVLCADSSLPPPTDEPLPPRKPPATQPAKSEDGELFPDVPATNPKSKSGSKSAPTPPATAKPAPKRLPPKPVPPRPIPPSPSSQPAKSTFTPTHRITLTSGRVIEGIPSNEGDKLVVKVELGTISIDPAQVEKMERISN